MSDPPKCADGSDAGYHEGTVHYRRDNEPHCEGCWETLLALTAGADQPQTPDASGPST
jgi:hypothetical protein